ncbi:hypothetical protein Pla52o_24210 [Novipirellula galeiformis]|uniref:Uncharacterized protein n=1 Tax=Novipirellula galeiformis TaxID=2528004 RepID=A0A5C6CJA5_9BACT|nr:hypothetical protein Pla52o_24210 [Novipirellula galeiformis]
MNASIARLQTVQSKTVIPEFWDRAKLSVARALHRMRCMSVENSLKEFRHGVCYHSRLRS